MTRTDTRFVLGIAAYVTGASLATIGAVVVAGWLVEAAARVIL